MVRTLISVCLLVTVAVSLIGCGGSTNPGGTPVTTVRLQAFGDPAELAAYKEMIAAFEKENADVRVEFIPVGKQKDHMTKLTTSFVGGDPPDLFLINFRRFGQFAEKDVLEPLGPRIFERGKIKQDDLFEQPVEAFTYNGTVQCVPQNVSSLVVYYNRALFEQYGVPLPKDGWTWDDFLAAGKALTRDTNGDGRPEHFGIGFEPTLIRLAPFIWQNGGEIVDSLTSPKQFTIEGPESTEALRFVRSWHQHKVAPPYVEAKAEDHESRFIRGGLAMILQSRRFTATLRGVKGVDWDVAPLPQSKHKVTVLHADAYCMARESKAKDAAYRFVEFALSSTGAEILARSGRTVPSVKSIANSPVFLDPSQPPRSAQVFLDSIPTIRRTPNVGIWNELETRADWHVEEWFYAEGFTPSLNLELNKDTQPIFDGGRR